MDVVRLGLGFRALRMRRHWRQQDLGDVAGVSRSLIARIGRGGAHKVTLAVLDRVAQRLDARLDVRVLRQGEALDRLLDARHAGLVELVVGLLTGLSWLTAVEVSFNVRGERGSIDILAFHAATRSPLVIEVKSVVPDIQAMLLTLDRKVRLARSIAHERGWDPATVSVILVLPEDRSARRRRLDDPRRRAAAQRHHPAMGRGTGRHAPWFLVPGRHRRRRPPPDVARLQPVARQSLTDVTEVSARHVPSGVLTPLTHGIEREG